MTASPANVLINLTVVIVAVTDDQPRVLIVSPADAGQAPRLPSGPFDPEVHQSLEAGLRSWVAEQTGLDLYYVEQLYTFGNRFRDPLEIAGGPRVVSVAYIALTHEDSIAEPGAGWQNWYDFLPWEDWRPGRPGIIDDVITPALDRWQRDTKNGEQRKQRRERINVTFGTGPASEMDSVLSLERFELLYEAGAVDEALRDRREAGGATDGAGQPDARLGIALHADHRRVLATALGRLRGKLAYRPVVFELLPGEFTLLQLQRVAEALSGAGLHKQNFRRLVLSGELVEPVGRTKNLGRGRPAELFRFRREVLSEKLTVGLSRPILRGADS